MSARFPILILLAVATTAVGANAEETGAAAASKVEGRSTAPVFEALDVNRDGTVSRNELRLAAVRQVRRQVRLRFAQLDRNHDGRVVRAEVVGMKAARFARFDQNGDGQFTLAELTSVMERQVVRRIGRLLARIDVDGDGRCSRTELSEHRREMARRRAAQQSHDAVAAKPARPTENPSGA